MSWSDEDTARVKAAYQEALEIMGRYKDEEVLKSVFFMLDGRIPDPDDVIQSLHNLAHSHLNNMIFLEEAKHTSTQGPNSIEVILHISKEREWFKCTLDIPETSYNSDNYESAKWLADEVRNKALKDRANGKLNNSNIRENTTWIHVEQAVAAVNTELIKNKDNYKGQGLTNTFDMITEELSKILQAQGKPAIKLSSFYRWIKGTYRKRKDVFGLLSDEAMKIIKPNK